MSTRRTNGKATHPATARGRSDDKVQEKTPPCVVQSFSVAPRVTWCGRRIWGSEIAYKDHEQLRDKFVSAYLGTPCLACKRNVGIFLLSRE